MTGHGAIELQLLFFQMFFMIAGVVGGIRVVEDVMKWRDSRMESRTSDA